MVTLSANFCIGILVPWVSSTNLITCDRNVSSPIFVALTFNKPLWLIVAPITSSSTFFLTGIDSPVAIDSSMALCPSIIIPSVGIFSPGFTIMMSFSLSCSIGISISSPSIKMRALFAPSSNNLRIAWEALPLALVSMYLPVRWNAIIIAATPE